MNGFLNYQNSLSRRFSFTAGFMLVPLFFLVFLQYVVFKNTVNEFKEAINHSLYEMNTIRRIQNNVHLAIMAPNDYVMHADRNERDNYNETARQVSDDLKKLSGMVFSKDHKEEYMYIDRATEHWNNVHERAVRLLEHPNPLGNRHLAMETELLDRTADRVISSLESLHGLVIQAVREEEENARQLQMIMIALIFGGTALTALLILWLNSMLGKSVIKPISCIKAAARKIGDGHFNTRLDWARKDEIGELSRSFDEMTVQLQNAHEELERLSRKDSLTGILNRREFDRLMRAEFNRAERYNKKLSIILIDLDHFKEINDSHGHQTGDSVLRTVVTVIEKAIRDVDQFARYGGEEFVLMLPESDSRDAMALAARLCGLVGSTEFRNQGGNIFNVTISAGVASFPEYEIDELNLMIAADQALYRAKRNGRNRAEYPKRNIKIINT